MIAVVTGGAGFIGTALTARLAGLGHDVRTIDQLPGEVAGAAHITADVRDVDAWGSIAAEADVIFHMAGPVASGADRSHDQALALQLDGTRAVVEVAASHSPRAKIVLASSFYVYTGEPSTEADESTPLDPDRMHPFGQIKFRAERIVRHGPHGSSGTHAIVRIGSVYGDSERCTNAVRDFCVAANRVGRIVVWGNPERSNQFTHIDDVVSGVILAASADSGVFNVIAPEVTTTGELARLVADRTDAAVVYEQHRRSGISTPYIRSDRLAALGWQARPLADALPLPPASYPRQPSMPGWRPTRPQEGRQ